MISLKEISGNKLVTLYSEDMNEEFICGFIIAYDENELVLSCVNHSGENDGFILLRRNGIYRVDYDSVYEKRRQQLYSIKKEKHESIIWDLEQFSLMDNLLLWAYTKKKIVNIYYGNDDNCVCGYLENLNDYKVKCIDIYECRDNQGFTVVDIQKADYIWVDSIKSRDAAMVFEFSLQIKSQG